MTYSLQDEDIYQLAYDMRAIDGRARVRDMKEGGHYTSTGPGSRIVEVMSGRMLLALRAFKKSRSIRRDTGITPRKRAQDALSHIDTNVAVALTIETMVNAVASNKTNTATRMRGAVGRAIRDHIWLKVHFTANPSMFNQLRGGIAAALKRNKGRAEIMLEAIRGADETVPIEMPLEDSDFLVLGAVLSELLLDCAPDVFEMCVMSDFSKTRRNKTLSYLRFTSEFSSNIENIEQLYAEVTPLHLPITEAPLPWTNTRTGGFYANAMRRRPLMGTRSSVQLKGMSDSQCPEVYQAINTLQSVRWVVDVDILEVLRSYLGEFTVVPESLGVPGGIAPVKPEYPGDEVAEDKHSKEWKAYANGIREYYRCIERWDRGRADKGRLLYLATMYSERGDAHYLVHGIDFRGRVYPTSSTLNYQGDDINRALCKFAEGKAIDTQEAADWFLIQGANCWGNDKVTFKDRVRWCYAHSKEIQAVAQDPLSYTWWHEADKPWCFLAWCLEAGRFLADPRPGFISHLPISMDGSNNGLQIYSLLLKDEVGGAATNCSPCDTPADIYQEVADVCTEKLLEDSDDPKHQLFAHRWLEFAGGKLPRKATKRVVMTDVYGSTPYSRQNYISEWYFDIVRGKQIDPPPFPPRSTYSATWWLASQVTDALSGVARAAQSGMEWLRAVANIASDQNIHLFWTAPSGLRVTQHYTKSTSRTVEIICRRKIKVYAREWTDDVAKKQSANGLCPNYIHSLDAAAAVLTINRAAAEGVTGFMMIHDSFGCHASDAPTLARVLREVYTDMFRTDLLAKLRDEFTQQLAPGTVLPPLPPQGQLDINSLIDSEYFFA